MIFSLFPFFISLVLYYDRWLIITTDFFPRVSRKLYVKHLRSELFPTYIMMNKMLMFRCDKMCIFANNYHSSCLSFYYIYGLSAMLIIRGCCGPLKAKCRWSGDAAVHSKQNVVGQGLLSPTQNRMLLIRSCCRPLKSQCRWSEAADVHSKQNAVDHWLLSPTQSKMSLIRGCCRPLKTECCRSGSAVVHSKQNVVDQGLLSPTQNRML